MTTREIKARIKSIDLMKRDDEGAHSEEDILYTEFIKSVANSSAPGLAQQAQLILTTKDIDFARWCA